MDVQAGVSLCISKTPRPVFSRQSPYNSFRGKINCCLEIITTLFSITKTALCEITGLLSADRRFL